MGNEVSLKSRLLTFFEPHNIINLIFLMIVQKIFCQFVRFKNFYDSVYQWEFFEVASFNTGLYGGHFTSMRPLMNFPYTLSWL